MTTERSSSLAIIESNERAETLTLWDRDRPVPPNLESERTSENRGKCPSPSNLFSVCSTRRKWNPHPKLGKRLFYL